MANLPMTLQKHQELPSCLAHAKLLDKGLPGFRTGKRQLLKEPIFKCFHIRRCLRTRVSASSIPKKMHRCSLVFISSMLDFVNGGRNQAYLCSSFLCTGYLAHPLKKRFGLPSFVFMVIFSNGCIK